MALIARIDRFKPHHLCLLLITLGVSACGSADQNSDSINDVNSQALTQTTANTQDNINQNSDPVIQSTPMQEQIPPQTESPALTNCTYDQIDTDMLAAVNNARAVSRTCGNQSMPAVASLTLACKLTQAAQNHSEDMATYFNMSHTGSDGSSMSSRIRATGYQFSSAAENIARGQDSVQSVMNAWLNSPGHCANIMRASVSQLGVGFAIGTSPNGFEQIFWTQNFARPIP